MEDYPNEKRCGSCENFKPLLEFNKCKGGTYGLHNHCRACQKECKRRWYLKNQEKELALRKTPEMREKAADYRRKLYHSDPSWREKQLEINRSRRRAEPAKIKARAQRKAWLEIPQNRIAQTLRGRINHALNGAIKYLHTEELLGCSFETLRDYLETKFLPGMTWDNHGQFGWHIDHIKPCSAFDLTDPEQQKQCFHYTNLQPLWWRDNLSKGGTSHPTL